MKLADVTETTEIVRPYVAGLQADTLPALRAHVEAWQELAPDAWAVVRIWTEDDFAAFKRAQAGEARGDHAGGDLDEKYLDVLMPIALVAVALVINEREAVPEGARLLRLIKQGAFVKDAAGCLRPVFRNMPTEEANAV